MPRVAYLGVWHRSPLRVDTPRTMAPKVHPSEGDGAMMPRSIEDVITELLEDADAGRLDPLRSVYVERQGESVDYMQVDAGEGWHMRAVLGFTKRRMLADGSTEVEYFEAAEWDSPDAWVYLPAPIEWAAVCRSDLAAWLIQQAASAL